MSSSSCYEQDTFSENLGRRLKPSWTLGSKHFLNGLSFLSFHKVQQLVALLLQEKTLLRES